MVVDIHEDDGGDAFYRPSVVAPGLSEAVAGDFIGDAYLVGGGVDDAPGLDARDELLMAATV